MRKSPEGTDMWRHELPPPSIIPLRTQVALDTGDELHSICAKTNGKDIEAYWAVWTGPAVRPAVRLRARLRDGFNRYCKHDDSQPMLLVPRLHAGYTVLMHAMFQRAGGGGVALMFSHGSLSDYT